MPPAPDQPAATAEPARPPTLLDLVWSFNRLTLLSFGGGMTLIAQRLFVEEKRWLSETEFLSAFALARVMPGANQCNFATYVGGRFHGVAGVLAALAGLLTLPFFIVLGLAQMASHAQDMPRVNAALGGMTVIAISLSLAAGMSVSGPYRSDPRALLFAAASFVAATFLKVPLIVILVVLTPLALLRHLRQGGPGPEPRAPRDE